jgi:phosphohistidine phosphatase
MNLLLWRHADAEDGVPDLARELSAKGRDQARSVARWLKRELEPEALLLVSPALRCRQTADALDLPYALEEGLAPGASAPSVLALIQREWSSGQAEATVLMVGHQPWIGELVSSLISGVEAPWSVRKAALWWLVRRLRSGQAQWGVRVVIDPDYV